MAKTGMPLSPNDEWNKLDRAAKANLSHSDLEDFFRYKKKLKSEGHLWQNDAESILRGFIWDRSESLHPDDESKSKDSD